ncbi:hypothetical protein [Segetibacter aerophilus]|uniref:Uncharacterized protein n=1 Tax=Segetibacter aerophilus TaxID=670293 RepID=A0A512B8A7_9BACT|nr:hypothetical protein [Segetibacter aerophilus]GEO08195.1 hypothetical protein SAE01_06910 [Segetibacter aerophilus]
MTILKLKILSIDLDQLVNFLIEEITFMYENHSIDMSVLMYEDFNYSTMTTQLDMMILKKEEDRILIDIIAGAGRTGFFLTDNSTEEKYTLKADKILVKYAEEHKLVVERLEQR